jgi:GT2 family glycosyltransferase
MLRCAVVILNWNGKKYLEQFLPSVVNCSSQPNVEVVVADNASTDNSVEYTKQNYPTVRVIELHQNHGFAGGYNEALKQVDAQYYVLLNSDVEVTENWLNPVLDLMDSRDDIAICMPKILSYNKKEYFEYAGGAGGYIDKLGFLFCRGRLFDTLEKDNGQYNDERSVFWASGASMFIKANIFHQIGGLDASFFAHMEEIDLCWRVKNAGYQVYYTPNSKVYHIGGGSLPKENANKTYFNFRNNLFMLAKNLPSKQVVIVLLFRLFIDALAAFYFLFTYGYRHFLAVVKAHFHFYKRIPYLMKYRKTVEYNHTHPEVYRKSIVFDYFVRGKKFYSCL